jgi:DNA-binding transcriptional ArsR family regulator
MPYLPSLTALRCLDASARSRSFTRAAQELHLTQSAVSHHILNLEQQLGVKLFERDKGRLELTQAGKIYDSPAACASESLPKIVCGLAQQTNTQCFGGKAASLRDVRNDTCLHVPGSVKLKSQVTRHACVTPDGATPHCVDSIRLKEPT